MPLPNPPGRYDPSYQFRPDRRKIIHLMARISVALGRRPKRKGGEAEPVPVEPPSPKHLSGGAAAPLEFDG